MLYHVRLRWNAAMTTPCGFRFLSCNLFRTEPIILLRFSIILMKYLIVISTLVTLTSCSHEYNCECDGYSLNDHLFTDETTVEANSERKAEQKCVAKFENYEDQYDTTNAGGLVVVSCSLE